MSELIDDVVDVIGVAVHGDTCTWNNEDWVAHCNACQEIVQRLMDGGMSETAIRNMLVNYQPIEEPKTLSEAIGHPVGCWADREPVKYFAQLAKLRRQLEAAKADGNQAHVDALVLEIRTYKHQANAVWGTLAGTQPTVTGASPAAEDGLPTA
ncbi:MAG TPA: hypothetical protein VMT30_02465 [Candidatus Saccharimonadia bacterium]|nr:hypothetical protein [Candidatus Saccharimonadia bacterium]